MNTVNLSYFNTSEVGLEQNDLRLPTKKELGERAYDTICFWMENGNSQVLTKEHAVNIIQMANAILLDWTYMADYDKFKNHMKEPDTFIGRMNNIADNMEEKDKQLIADAASVGMIGVAALVSAPVAIAGGVLWALNRKK